MRANGDMGGQGFEQFHTATQAAVLNGDASGLEGLMSTTGADAATVLCYLHPFYDGRQPGGCPTMYFRDSTATMQVLQQHEMWVALEAGAGIVSEHDYDAATGRWWNVTNDPSPPPGTQSPLNAFQTYRALNRLALRTRLNISSDSAFLAPRGQRPLTVRLYDGPETVLYNHSNCYNGHGGIEIDTDPLPNLTMSECVAHCVNDPRCDCVVRYDGSDSGKRHTESASGVPAYAPGDCWRRSQCDPTKFEHDAATTPFTVALVQRDPSGYRTFIHSNCYSGHGGVEIDAQPIPNLTESECTRQCSDDPACDCVVRYTTASNPKMDGGRALYADGDCWRRSLRPHPV